MAKYLKEFSTTAEYESYINNSPTLPNVSLTLDDNVVHYNKKPDYSKEYLTFEALESGTFSLMMSYPSDSIMTSISYSVDNGANWVDTVIGETSVIITTPTVNAGDKVLWKGIGTKLGNPSNGARSARFTSTGNCNVSGNIMSLLYGDNFAKQTTIPNNGAFAHVFSTYYGNGCKIVSAENLVLPSTTLVYDCYSGMFEGCKSLTTAPELPATTLAGRCYENMFSGCTALTTAPELPATTLLGYCYAYMFNGCRSLVNTPELPATTLEDSCYQYMFSGCTSLTTAPELPATTLKKNCYESMFSGCTSLTTAPELPATTLVQFCYTNIFKGCTNLNSITMLATTIPDGSLNNWVQGVAATGTFTKAASATIPTGTSGIPSGWTVETATA